MLFRCRDKSLEIGKRTYIMGILNMTPDSFSDGGKYNTFEKGLERALQMIEEGADIIDVGGESTRPGYTPVDEEEEMRRVIPIIEKLSKISNVIISVDTMKSNVALRALEAGAHIVNDVWGLQRDPQMAEVVAKYHAGVIMMHNSNVAEYEDVVKDIVKFLQKSIEIGEKAGIDKSQMVVDPGIVLEKL